MSRVPCPGCNRPVDREAPECPACGMPVLAMLGPTSTKLHPALIVLLVVTGGFGALMVLGIAAAILIPQLAASRPERAEVPELLASDSAAIREGVRGLLAAYELQQAYVAAGASGYASSLDDPSAPGFLTGWVDPGSQEYDFRVSRSGESLCIDAVPASATAFPLSIDGVEMVYFGLGCRGAPEWEDPRIEWLAGE